MYVRILILVIGVFACSTAAIFIRLSNIHPIMLASLRLLGATALLSPMFFRDWRRYRHAGLTRELLNPIIPGILLGIHFISWITGIRLAIIANGSLIVNLVPVAMPFFLFLLIREKLTAREWLATAIAMVGTGVLLVSDYQLDRENFIGDLICFASMLFFCCYLALSRKYRTSRSIWLYVVPLYGTAGIFCLLAAILWGWIGHPEALPQLYPLREWLWALCLAMIPTVIGHSILNHSMKIIRGQVVSIFTLTQFVFAGILAYLVFQEIPHGSLYVAAVLLITAAVIVLDLRRKKTVTA